MAYHARIWAFCLVLMHVAVYSAVGILCYECNSQNDPRCMSEPFDNRTTDMVDCSQKTVNIELPKDNKPYASICRKIVQKIQGAPRVYRGCGWLTDDTYDDGRTCRLRTGTYEVQVYYCSCNKSGCNDAPISTSLPSMWSLLLLGAAAAKAATVL